MTKSIDEIIREAMQRGEFDNLPNKGKKLNLDDYFNTPEDLRVGYAVLKSGDFLPEEVQLLQEIAGLKEKLDRANLEEERKKLRREIEGRRLRYNLLMERFKRQGGV
ncbi:MAG TPA: DUF1992 domain-containing protein [Anaerolineales bacterium]|jgi:hypothetical protein